MIFSDLTVLYVEDEIIVAIETAELLRDIGFGQVLVAHNLRTAERLEQENAIDVAVLDVNLGNGERSIDLGLRLAEGGTKVIFASGYNLSELSEKIQGFDFIEKPFTQTAFTALVGRIAARSSGAAAAE